MSATESDPEALLRVIYAARVPYPRDGILVAFIQRAADRERAARYLWARCGTPDGTLATTSVNAFLAVWEELIRLCRIFSQRTLPRLRQLAPSPGLLFFRES